MISNLLSNPFLSKPSPPKFVPGEIGNSFAHHAACTCCGNQHCLGPFWRRLGISRSFVASDPHPPMWSIDRPLSNPPAPAHHYTKTGTSRGTTRQTHATPVITDMQRQEYIRKDSTAHAAGVPHAGREARVNPLDATSRRNATQPISRGSASRPAVAATHHGRSGVDPQLSSSRACLHTAFIAFSVP